MRHSRAIASLNWREALGCRSRRRTGRVWERSPQHRIRLFQSLPLRVHARPTPVQWATSLGHSVADSRGWYFGHSVARIRQEGRSRAASCASFEVPGTKKCEQKFWDVEGLYWILRRGRWCCAAKRRRNAKPWRLRSGDCPAGRGDIRTQTHGYIRHGTVTLFAALSYPGGPADLTATEQRHTRVEWLRFLKQIDRQTSDGVDLHVIAENY